MKSSKNPNTQQINFANKVSINKQDIDNIIQKLKEKIENRGFVKSQISRFNSMTESSKDSIYITFPKVSDQNQEAKITFYSKITTVSSTISKTKLPFEAKNLLTSENLGITSIDITLSANVSNNISNPLFTFKAGDETLITLSGTNLAAQGNSNSTTLQNIDVNNADTVDQMKNIFQLAFNEVLQEKIQQAEQVKAKAESEQQKQAEAKAKQKAFEEAQKSFKTANNELQDELKKFNEDGQNANDLLEKVKAVKDNFKKLEEQATKLNTLNQEAKISTEFKEQKLYADFLGVNLKPKGQDQPDFMKGLSGNFYKPYKRLLEILEKSGTKIDGKEDLIKQLEGIKDKGFALSRQIESNLETFFKRLKEKIQGNEGNPKTLQGYCKEVALTLDSDTGTGKTMFVDSLLGSTEEKNKYFTNKQENGNFKKEGLADLGKLLYGDKAVKKTIHCGLVGFEEIKKQINDNKDAIIALDEWHRLNKEQKKELNSLLKGEKVIKITATPTDGLYKALKKGDLGKEKQNLLSAKEERKSKILKNVASAQDFAQLELKEEYCLSIIDADGSILASENMIESNKGFLEFEDIFGKNLESMKFNENKNKEPQVIILPPDKDGKNIIYVLNGEEYECKKEVDKNALKTILEGKKRVFQVFGPSNQEEAKYSRGNIDGGDNGTPSINNPKILIYSLDNKIVKELKKFLDENKKFLDNKQKAQLVNLINKYDEFIVQAYGRARADTTDITFKNREEKDFHETIQNKKKELLTDGVFKTEINGTNTLVDYQGFVNRFDKNLPKEDREKIIVQAFLKVANEENNSKEKEGSLKVQIEAIGDPKRFNEVYNIIKSLSKEQGKVLMEVCGYDEKKGLLEQQNALETIQATIKSEIEAKRAIYNINGQKYYDFRELGEEQGFKKIEDKITIKIASDGKVSLDGVGGVSEGKFESLLYLNKNSQEKDTILNEANANDFKKHIENHFKENNKRILQDSVNKYSEIIEKLQILDLTADQIKQKKSAEQDLKNCLELTTQLTKLEIDEFIKGLNDDANLSKLEEKLADLMNENKTLQEENDKKIKELKDENNDLMQASATNNADNANKQKQIEELQAEQEKLQQNKKTLETENEKIQTLISKAAEEKERIVLKNSELQEKIEKQQGEIVQYAEEKTWLQQASETAQQAVEELKTQLASVLGLSNEKDKNLKELEEQIKQLQEQQAKEIKQLQEQQKLTQEQLEAKNKDLQKELDQKNQEIIQMKQEHSEKLKEEGEKFQTLKQLTEETEAKIAEILKNKGSNGNIDALFDGENLKTLYHTASEFEKIGQSNLDFQKDGKYDTKCYESFLKIKDDNQDKETKDSEKFDLLRESIIQSSAIREKHSILQEVLQEKNLMSGDLKAYEFKSLDKLIDGDNFTDLFKAELKNLGFGKGENGVWTKGDKEGNKVTYDTKEPYVKDFLINAYYEENFKQFKETLEQGELNKLEQLAVDRYNAKQKLEFVEQIVNYQAVLTYSDSKAGSIDENKLNDYIEIANIIANKNTTYEERFNSENHKFKELEQKIITQDKNIKIEVGSKGALLVNPENLKTKSVGEESPENVPDDDKVDSPNAVNSSKDPVLLKVNQALLYMIEKDDNKTSSELESTDSNNSTNFSVNELPNSSHIKPKDVQNLLQNSLKEYYQSIKKFLSSSPASGNEVLPNGGGEKPKQQQ